MADDDNHSDFEGPDVTQEDENFEELMGEDDSGDVNAGTQIRPELKKLYAQHPELIIDYVESVISKISPKGQHKTYPFLTIYEKTKIIGLRSNQLSQGAKPYIAVPEHVVSVREIARMELEQKRLPFIIKRPLPNGNYEYWRLADLMILT
jgi:DNA-directed RNA polymerase subunit K/omega